MTKIRPIVKYHGGKYHLSDWILKHLAHTKTYLEMPCGMANVLLNKRRCEYELLLDIDPNITTLLQVVRDRVDEFQKRLRQIPYSEDSLRIAQSNGFDHPSINEYVIRRMSRGGLGKDFAWSERLRGGIPGDVNAWNTSIDNLTVVSNRLQGVHIVNGDVLTALEDLNWGFFETRNLLIYLDPPYVPDTRVTKTAYVHEMTEDQHEQLLDRLLAVSDKYGCKIAISGYLCELYHSKLKKWTFKCKTIPNHSGQSRVKKERVECLWLNY